MCVLGCESVDDLPAVEVPHDDGPAVCAQGHKPTTPLLVCLTPRNGRVLMGQVLRPHALLAECLRRDVPHFEAVVFAEARKPRLGRVESQEGGGGGEGFGRHGRRKEEEEERERERVSVLEERCFFVVEA